MLVLFEVILFQGKIVICFKHIDRGKMMDLIYLDFCKAFNIISHHLLLSKLEKYGFEG